MKNEDLDSHKSGLVNSENYGGDYYNHLIEEYKLYVEMTDRMSARRIQSSQFYISLLSALFGVTAVLIEKNVFLESEGLFLLSVSLLGIILCFIWNTNINSYKEINRLKFKVIQEMEINLPFPCYAREWEIEKEIQQYKRLSRIEKYIPASMAFLYFGLSIYSVFRIFGG